MLFSTTSALTHIFPEVRLDGLKVLDVLLGVCPQAVTEGWSASTSTGSATHGQRVLEAYLSILHIRGGQGTTVSSPTARLVALESFGRFLRAALFPAAELRPDDLVDVQLPTWFFAPSFASTHDFDAFIAAMEPTSRAPVRAWDAPAEPIERFDLASPDRHGPGPSDLQTAVDDLLRANETTTSTQGTQNALTLLTLLHPTLTSTFLEAAPTAFAPSAGSTSGPHLAIALCAARIARDLWRACTTDHLAPSKADHKALRTLVEKMAVYFPFAGDDNLLYARNNEVRRVWYRSFATLDSSP
jgi:pre-rRNA-processing protein IPI1